jgi:hypothetical protein
MKKLIVISISTLILFCSSSFYQSKSYSSDLIEVYFSNKQTFNDLVNIKADLSQKSVILDYKLLEFDKANKLSSISFEVTSEGKYCGSGKTSTLQKQYGFSIDRSPNAEIYFKVGLTK